MTHITHPKTPTVAGQLGVSNGSVTALIDSNVVPVGVGTMPSYTEADAGYFTSGTIPLTRVGDNSYLPLDIKADFRGAIYPWAQTPYFLEEPDGSVTALRPGYNGEYVRVFYAYSPTGSYAPNDFRLTDSEYRPTWLTDDEYVTNVFDGNDHGMAIEIRSTSDLTERRFYWVEHNGSLDSRFHVFLDVTTTMAITPTIAQTASLASPITNGGATYISEANAFVVSTHNNSTALVYAWYTVNREFSSSRSVDLAPALPTKSIDWKDLSGATAGINSAAVVVNLTTADQVAKYFTYTGEPGPKVSVQYLYAANRRTINYAYDNGIVRLFTPLYSLITYSARSTAFGWSVTTDYDITANTLRYNPVTDDPQRFQQMPWVISFDQVVDESAVPSTITDAYKANKFPISMGRNPAIRVGNATLKLQICGNNIVESYAANSGTLQFAALSLSLDGYEGTTLAQRKMDALRRLNFMRAPASWLAFVPYDASLMSKSLAHIMFIDNTTLRGTSTTRLYGQGLSDKNFTATLPGYDATSSVYSVNTNSMRPSLPTPTSVTGTTGVLASSSITASISGDGPMVISKASYGALDATAAAWLSVGINANTGIAANTYSVDATTFKAKMAAVTAATIAQSTFKPVNAYTSINTLMYITSDTSTATFLYYMAFGNNSEAIQWEFAVIQLSIVAGKLVWPDDTLTAVKSRSPGGIATQAQSNNVGPQYFSDWETMAVYQHTDGTTYILAHTPTFIGTVTGNLTEQRTIKLDANWNITGTVLNSRVSTWRKFSSGIHPKYGLYYTDIWNDFSAKAIMTYCDFTSVTSQSDRLRQSAELWLTGSGARAQTVLVSSRSASGFVVYNSEIPVIMNGKVGVIPTQTINLATVAAEPANKTFYCYAQWTGTQFTLTPSLSVLPESGTSTYMGSIVTSDTGIKSSSLNKVTRIDTFRLYDSLPILGSAIRTYQVLPAIEAYVYNTTADATALMNAKNPTSQAAVLSTWSRTLGAAYYPTAASTSGVTAAWKITTKPDTLVQPNDTIDWASVISPNSFGDFTMETTLYSSDADDGAIGVVAAFFRMAVGNNLQVIVSRTAGGIAQTQFQGLGKAADATFAFQVTGVNLTDADKSKIAYKTVGEPRAKPSGSGWGGSYSRIRVVRAGSIITAQCSDWSSDRNNVPLLESSEITLDLSTITLFSDLLPSARFGYTTFSQPQATFYDTTFAGGLDASRVIDLEAGVVWRYNFLTSAWEATSVSPSESLGYNRIVTNPITGIKYQVTIDGVTPI